MLSKIPLKIKRIIHPASNAVCGLVLKVLKPFKKGDFLEVRGKLGAVKLSGIRKTTLSALDGKEIELNNTVFYTGRFHNLTSENIVQLNLKVRVNYRSEMALVKESILAFMNDEPSILSDPKVKIKAGKIDQAFIELNVIPWCTLNDYEKLSQTLEAALGLHLMHQGFASPAVLNKNQNNSLNPTKTF